MKYGFLMVSDKGHMVKPTNFLVEHYLRVGGELKGKGDDLV